MLFSEAKFFISDPPLMPVRTRRFLAVSGNGSKKITTSFEKEKKRKQKITSPASIKSKDTRQQFKQSPCIQTNKDACQGLREKKRAQL